MPMRFWGERLIRAASSTHQRALTHTLSHTLLQLDKALDLLDQQDAPFSHTEYLSLLKTCNKCKSLPLARRLHAHLAHHRVPLNGFFGENLLVTLAKCGASDDACHVFHSLPCRTVFAWTALISCFTDLGRPHDALIMYQSMLDDGVEPDSYTFVTLFKACGMLSDLDTGRKLHESARRRGFASEIFIGNTLVSMYGKCGAVVEAEIVFTELPKHDVVSCNAMISVYVEQEEAEKALRLYRQMCEEGMNLPDEHTIVFALQAVRIFSEEEEAYFLKEISPRAISLEIGEALHAQARKKSIASSNFVGNTLISMYGNCGTIAHAVNAYHGLTEPNIVSKTATLSAFLEQGQPEMVLQLYKQLSQGDISSNHQTFLIALQACGNLADKEEACLLEDGQLCKIKSLEISRAVHTDARARGLDTSLFVGNTLVSMYGKCGAISEAEQVFARFSHMDVVSWNAMLSAYVEQGQADHALRLYRQMREERFEPNRQTFLSVLQACDDLTVRASDDSALQVCSDESAGREEACALEGSMTESLSFEIGLALHADAKRRGVASDVFVGTTLVRMYGKCGALTEAENAFCNLSHNDIVACTAMLSAYIEQGEDEKALGFYKRMQEEDMLLDEITLVCILQASRRTGRVEIGRQLHFATISGGVDLNSFLGSALVYAYGTSGSNGDAKATFNTLPWPDMASRNACVVAFAGSRTSFRMLEEMQLEGLRPDALTFVSILSACSHAGLVDAGIGYFESMGRDYSLQKDVNHYVLMVDLLGRAGDFVKVVNFVMKVPKQADLATWLCLLSACRTHGNVELAKSAFDHVVNLQTKDPAAYVLMSNVCADEGGII